MYTCIYDKIITYYVIQSNPDLVNVKIVENPCLVNKFLLTKLFTKWGFDCTTFIYKEITQWTEIYEYENV